MPVIKVLPTSLEILNNYPFPPLLSIDLTLAKSRESMETVKQESLWNDLETERNLIFRDRKN